MYTLKLLNDFEYDSLPYKRVKNSVGCADQKTKTAYVRRTGVDIFDLGTMQHELDELIAKNSSHQDEDGIRYKGKEPSYTPPPAPKLPTAEELMAEAMQFGQTNYPLTYGSREGALADLLKGTSYYEQFQPTSFEDALANQYFKNVWPDQEAQIKQALSMSGMAYSPILAEQLGQAKGKLGTDIGSYLSELGNTRAQNSLNQRLQISPEMSYNTQLQTNVNQSNAQAQLDFQAAQAKAMSDYQNALAKYNKKAAQTTAITTGIGTGLGFMVGGPAGAALGAGIGGQAGALFGGGASPISFQDALAMSQIGQPTSTDKLLSGLFGQTGTTGTPTAGLPQAVNTSQYRMNMPSFSNLGGGY